MLEIPNNTLAHYEKLPQLQLIKLADVNAQVFAKGIVEYRKSVSATNNEGGTDEDYPDDALVTPDNEAVQFYLFNHVVSIIKTRYTRHEVLPDWARDVMQEYKRILVIQGQRLTCYMALVTARESRHMGSKDVSWWKANIVEKYGQKTMDFNHHIKAKGSDYVVSYLQQHAPGAPVGDLFKSIEVIFFKGSFSGGYGGKPWGMIAQCLNHFLDGKTTQEMMIDTAYTLAHNNGPMFNKGMLYNHYTGEFKKLLDVQRGGMMPEYINEYGMQHLADHQKKLWTEVLQNIGSEFGKYVDWYAIEKAGALATYPNEKTKQDKKWGKKKEKPVPFVFNGQAATQVGTLYVTPTQSVPIIKRATVIA